MREPAIAAIFDLDGTLYTGHVGRGIELHHRTHKVNRFLFYFYMFTHLPLWPLQRLGIVSEAATRGLWGRHLGWTVRGFTRQEARAAFGWIAHEYVLPRVRPDILAQLHDHQAAGHRVILVSGTFSPLLAEIGSQLGVEETVGTPLVLSSGRYTGASERPVCQGVGKVLRLESYLGDEENILWHQSYAYADSITDLPLMELVGHPVAVYPDGRLTAHAMRVGWEINPGING